LSPALTDGPKSAAVGGSKTPSLRIGLSSGIGNSGIVRDWRVWVVRIGPGSHVADAVGDPG
jgi:hypothetical protein